MKKMLLVIPFLLSSLVIAHDDEGYPAFLFGGLDWSSDGQYIAVGTNNGVYIHDSSDLSLLDHREKYYDIKTVAWSNNGLKLAYYNYWVYGGITIYDLESGKNISLLRGLGRWGVESLHWAPSDKYIAAGSNGSIFVWDVETQQIKTSISMKHFKGPFGHTLIDWSPRPNDVYIVTGAIGNGTAIWNYYTGELVDFIWRQTNTSPAKWSPDGTRIAAGENPVVIYPITYPIYHEVIDKFAGDIIQKFTYEDADFQGMSWHPDSTKLAFMKNTHYAGPLDPAQHAAIILDTSTGTFVELPGVFLSDTIYTEKVIEWSPDGSKLACISSDGRIVIWDTNTYEIIAEYDGHGSILDYYAENP